MQLGVQRSYIVQTSNKVVKRCILMTSDPGDLVLGPHLRLRHHRLRCRAVGPPLDHHRHLPCIAGACPRPHHGRALSLLPAFRQPRRQLKKAEVTSKALSNAPTYNNIRQGFVYERVPHITLKSIANNAEIDVIWEKFQGALEPLRAELNASLNRIWEEWEIPREPGDPWSAPATAAWSKCPGGGHERSKVGGASRVEPRVGPRLPAG